VRVRRLATIRFGIVAEAPQGLAWLSPRRVAVVAGNPYDGATLVMADPVAGRVVSRRRLDPAGIATVRAGDRLVLLHTPVDQIGPVRLSVVDARGRLRTVELAGARGGFQSPPDWDRPGAYGISRDAGLAVDPEGGRAFVVAAGPTVVEVDLDSLQVTYRQLRQPLPLLRRLARWLVPPAEAKLAAGSWRSACWLGGGTLAVWGTDARVSGDTPETLRSRELPSGVKLIDTLAWTIRPLDPAATRAGWQAGRLLAYGGTWDNEAQRQRGVGVTVYGPGNGPPRHLLGTKVVDEARLHGDLVYASVDNGGEQRARVVVSLRGGRVLASSEGSLPHLLLDDRGQAC
jgi:DNA-binding beta-propeller fold protein YncE